MHANYSIFCPAEKVLASEDWQPLVFKIIKISLFNFFQADGTSSLTRPYGEPQRQIKSPTSRNICFRYVSIEFGYILSCVVVDIFFPRYSYIYSTNYFCVFFCYVKRKENITSAHAQRWPWKWSSVRSSWSSYSLVRLG